MAVAEPCCEKEWEQWRRDMEENRRRRWRRWVRCWAKAEVSEDKDEQGGDWEEERAEPERRKVSEKEGDGDGEREEREKESGGRLEEEGGGQEAEDGQFVGRQEGTWMRKWCEESHVEKESEEEMDGKCDKEVDKDEGRVDEGEGEVKWNKRKVNESERKNDDDTHQVEETKEGSEEEEASSEIGGDDEKDDNEKEKEEYGEKCEEGKFGVGKLKEKDTMSHKADEDQLLGMKKEQVLENQDNKSANAFDEEMRAEGTERRQERDNEDGIEESRETGEMEAKDEEEGKEEPGEKCDCYVDKDEEEEKELEELEEKLEMEEEEKESKMEEMMEEQWEVEEEEKERKTEEQLEVEEEVLEEKMKEREGEVKVDEGDVEEDVEGVEEEEGEHQKRCEEQASGTWNLQSPDLKTQNNPTYSAENNFQGPTDSENEESNQSESEDEHFNCTHLKRREVEIHESNTEEASIVNTEVPNESSCNEIDKEEDRSETVTVETQSLQDNGSGLQKEDQEEEVEEEESTDDEEEFPAEEGESSNDEEDAVKVYHKEDFVHDFFGTLNELRSRSVLTNLILTTVDGSSLHVHAAVMAAVSSHIRASLGQSDEGGHPVEGCREGGLRTRSLSLGPNVDRVGLEAIVQFAYTGLLPCQRMDTIRQIKPAAESLGAIRVLDVCAEVEDRWKRSQGQKKDAASTEGEMVKTLQSIKQLWTDEVGCDVTLEVLGGTFCVHRVILAVCSDYFRSMFTLGMKESHQSCIHLPFLLASDLKLLIDCSYSGTLPLSWACVFEITSTALQLQFKPVLSLCLNFLQQEITPRSCLDVASFAEAYEMAQLQETADDFVLRQFQKVACTLKFLDLPAKQLMRYLNSHSLCVSSELVVFKAVVAWIQAKPKRRLKLAKDLMKTIHFPLMTFKEFNEVHSLNMWTDHSMVELYEAVFEDFCANETEPQSQWRIYVPKESLVLIGGDQTSDDLGSRSISKDLWFGHSVRNHTGIRKAMDWRKLGEMPESARFRHEVAVLNGKLYVLGGKKYYGTYDTLGSVFRFDPLQNRWESLAEMRERRCSFSVVLLDGNIYAIGGHCDSAYLDNVERYCPTANSWSFSRPLDQPLAAHVAKVLRGQVFVSGGKSSDYHSLASLFVYHPQSGSTSMAAMARPRAHHCMEVLAERLYVAGGISTDERMGVADQLACEVYSPATDSWTAVLPLPVPHVGAASAVLEGKFYVLGGYSQEDYSDSALVHRFDPAAQRWENMGKMPGPNNDIKACTLHLPQHLRL